MHALPKVFDHDPVTLLAQPGGSACVNSMIDSLYETEVNTHSPYFVLQVYTVVAIADYSKTHSLSPEQAEKFKHIAELYAARTQECLEQLRAPHAKVPAP